MSHIDVFALIGLVIRFISVGVLLIYIVPKQFDEVLRPKSWLTRLRWKILFLILFTVISALPVLTYQYQRVFGHISASLQNVATICSNIGYAAMVYLFVSIYNYKKKE